MQKNDQDLPAILSAGPEFFYTASILNVLKHTESRMMLDPEINRAMKFRKRLLFGLTSTKFEAC
ncbi:hypothetical protein A6X21_20000 [Planctopirus hydrillae]|uniref:Uncharacterized protein n=1 Tax=Planctopirus hydrillae TaxID=1841610 RepID=A0A1C3EHC0_9PLAN|nr:hypothetical protein A6X21_20000 [Planctopirus hydrillae]